MSAPDPDTTTSTGNTPPSSTFIISATGASSSTTSSGALPSHSDAYSGDGSTTNNSTSSGLVNYYFVFIALFLVLCFLAVWFWLRKRAKARHARLHHQEQALSRDLAGSNAGRAWTYGESRRNQDAGAETAQGFLAMVRRGRRGVDEGLDERGEAPPPYKPRNGEEEAAMATDGAGGRRRSGEVTQSAQEDAGVAIPLRTLAREDVGLKPPDYSEAVAREMEEGDAAGRGPSGASSREERRT